jgi:malonate-semialdehyde dehydrogenase (acetylating)/methylmalonate-semialdehyde dehydrogenase
MGPVISAGHRDRIVGLIDSGFAQGAELVLDGRGLQVPGLTDGFFVGPTLFDRVSPGMEIYREEIFGPVLIVLRVATYEEALALIHANPYGNGTAIFTRSGHWARRFQHEVEVGMVGINVPIPVPMAFFSFGGWKDSLFGDLHMHGMEGVYFYTRTKVVTSRWPAPAERTTSGLTMPTLG